MKKRGGLEKAFIIAIVIMLFSLSPFLVSGVSVSPGNVYLDYTPNGIYEGVTNWGTGGRTDSLNISTYTNDNLKITTDNKFIVCGEGQCLVKYKVVMPASYETPGMKRGYITGTEYFAYSQGASINVLVAMNFAIYIWVPYPGKYLELVSFQATNVPAGEDVQLTGTFVSRGNETIKAISADMLVYDKENKLLATIPTNTAHNIVLNQEVSLKGTWKSGDYKQGNYRADILVKYDDLKINASTKFKLGGLDVELINYTPEVIIGGIKPFQVSVESIWSEYIPNMHAQVSVINASSLQEITSFPTLTYNLAPWGTAVMDGYLDTANLKVGDYKLKITLFFENLTKEYDGNLKIINPPKEKSGGPSIFSKLGAFFTTKTIMVLLIILLIAAVAFIVLILLPKKKKEKKE